MSSGRKLGFAAVAAVALAAAPVAVGKPHTSTEAPNGNANGWSHNHSTTTTGDVTVATPGAGGPVVKYVFKGTYAGAGVVTVNKGNAHVRKRGLTGVDVTFDLSTAKLVVDDTNGDGAETVDDIVVGDKVHVQARLPKADPGLQPFVARKLIDQTHNADEPITAPVTEPVT